MDAQTLPDDLANLKIDRSSEKRRRKLEACEIYEIQEKLNFSPGCGWHAFFPGTQFHVYRQRRWSEKGFNVAFIENSDASHRFFCCVMQVAAEYWLVNFNEEEFWLPKSEYRAFHVLSIKFPDGPWRDEVVAEVKAVA
jgi:hypothetical protein